MAEFCTCGSIIINNRCTNKNCNVKIPGADHAVKTVKSKTGASAKKEQKKMNPRRSSKCITYNIDDLNRKQEENVE